MVTLVDLPTELLLAVLQACTSLYSATALSSTCRRFHDIYRLHEHTIIFALLPKAFPGYHHARLLAIEELQLYPVEDVVDEATIQRDLRSWLPTLLRNANMADQVCRDICLYQDRYNFSFAPFNRAREDEEAYTRRFNAFSSMADRGPPKVYQRRPYEASYYFTRRLKNAYNHPELQPRLRARVKAERKYDLHAHDDLSDFLVRNMSDYLCAQENVVKLHHFGAEGRTPDWYWARANFARALRRWPLEDALPRPGLLIGDDVLRLPSLQLGDYVQMYGYR